MDVSKWSIPTSIPAKSLDTFGKLQELMTVVCIKFQSWVPPLSDIPKSISVTSAGRWILGPCPPKLIAAHGENLGDKQLGRMTVGLGLPDTSTALYCFDSAIMVFNEQIWNAVNPMP
jgi:hypothetical protein